MVILISVGMGQVMMNFIFFQIILSIVVIIVISILIFVNFISISRHILIIFIKVFTNIRLDFKSYSNRTKTVFKTSCFLRSIVHVIVLTRGSKTSINILIMFHVISNCLRSTVRLNSTKRLDNFCRCGTRIRKRCSFS
ncbi:hypothetical protein HanXRQr2_Chr02g0068521 [Helianthus annuus]|uniref:Uncharacterized protein n=1 Tax=Helianthus annuus TaxID=4232 RepID=A0A9K3JN73_HELAN|nr:hypothetical protein HanXRQr2_Chr02g0068521 [Helianthus annuus]KAJ0951968.1 hypothetical protein HanPSC8_Chr02g0066621 [Helianthus annuus]